MKRMKKAKNIFVMSDDEIDDGSSKIAKEVVSTINTNQIYFYDDVTKTSIFNLNRQLDVVTKNLLITGINFNLKQLPPIELYVSSDGGELFSAFSAVDRIKYNQVPVHSYVEGLAASAATLLSVVAHRRFIRRNSFMLIHQVSGGLWGSFAAFKDEVQNLELLMAFIKKIYLEHTKFTEEELDNILKHDIYLNAEECLAKGLVDEIV
jgi:ATP-dependent Clp protease protease subunit